MAFVLLALGVLVAVPALLQRRLAPLRAQAESADEARTRVSRVQFALASQMSALRGALLTPDTLHPGTYAEARTLERAFGGRSRAALRRQRERVNRAVPPLGERGNAQRRDITRRFRARPPEPSRTEKPTARPRSDEAPIRQAAAGGGSQRLEW